LNLSSSGRVPHLIRNIEGLGDVAFDSGPATSSLGPVCVELIPKPSEWAIVVKGGKRISLPEYMPSSSLSSSGYSQELVLLIRGEETNSVLFFGKELGCAKGNN
jgi:hypothetical protein